MKIKKSVTGYIVTVPKGEEFNSVTKSGIIINTDFDNAKHIKQYAEVLSVENNDKNVEEGDTLVFHYNIVSHSFTNGQKTESNYLLFKDDKVKLYTVPTTMAHAVIKKGTGEIKMLNEYCFIKPYKKPEEVTKSGIISKIESDVKGSEKASTIITHIGDHDELAVGDRVMLDTYANYDIALPNDLNVWAIRTVDVLLKYLDNEV